MWSVIKAFKKRNLQNNNSKADTATILENQLSQISKLCVDSCLDARNSDLDNMKKNGHD